MKKPLVSIILPVYNGEKYLEYSIESILAQTYKNWELIIVDDCSKDGTNSIAKRYTVQDHRVKLIRNADNKRLPASLNVGFEEAKGEYLTWTSDDNLYLPDAIETMVVTLNDNSSIPMVVAKMDVIDENGSETGEVIKYDPTYMYYDNCVGACFMYRKSVRDDIGDYNCNLFLAEDYDYWLRILRKYGVIYPIDKTLYKYRRHVGSLSSTRFHEIRKCVNGIRLNYIDSIIQFYHSNPEYICRIYWDFKRYGGLNEQLTAKLLKEAPVLEKEIEYDSSVPIVVYGAGDYGNKAFSHYGNKIKYYVDKDERKVGKLINGIMVLSVEKIATLKDYQIMIAVSDEKIAKVLDVLLGYGIEHYVVFQNSIPIEALF